MESIEIESSSDEEDYYSNSVSRLKALKQRYEEEYQIEREKQKSEEQKDPIQKAECSNVQNQEETIARRQTRQTTRQMMKGINRGRKKGSRSKNEKQQTANDDSDLEIVSVEENIDRKNLGNSKETENDVLIVENTSTSGINTTASSEEEDYAVDMKILWCSRDLHRLKICKREKFHKIYEHFANLEGVSLDQILLMKRDKIIKKHDTPTSINLSVIDILEGGVLKKCTEKTTESSGKGEDCCTIKVQTKSKITITVSLEKTESFEKLFNACAEKLSVEKSKMKIYFDGEIVDENDTPDNLDIDDEACFDLRL